MAKGKESNVAMIVIPVLLAAAGFYFLLRKKKPNVSSTALATSGGATSTQSGGAAGLPDKVIVAGNVVSIDFPLLKGSKGAFVKALQTALMQYFPALPKGYNDSKFGKNTEADLFKVTKKKMVETQSDLDAIIRGGALAAAARNAKILGVYSPMPPMPFDPFYATKNI